MTWRLTAGWQDTATAANMWGVRTHRPMAVGHPRCVSWQPKPHWFQQLLLFYLQQVHQRLWACITTCFPSPLYLCFFLLRHCFCCGCSGLAHCRGAHQPHVVSIEPLVFLMGQVHMTDTGGGFVAHCDYPTDLLCVRRGGWDLVCTSGQKAFRVHYGAGDAVKQYGIHFRRQYNF